MLLGNPLVARQSLVIDYYALDYGIECLDIHLGLL